MKLCQNCGQLLAEEIATCPSCGSEVGEGRKHIDDYRIVDVLHEGHASLLCRAIRERTNEPVMIRLFMPESGVDENVAERLRRELEELKKLPEDGFVRHYAIRRSIDDHWYRISEWVDAQRWGDLLASGQLKDYRITFKLFHRIASILAVLHEKGHFIPHLILDDIIAIKDVIGDLDIKIDYKLSRYIDPKLDRPGPMLKHLLECHPDIINNRPLDFRSDIWSLGKIFVELLTADFETCDHLAKVDELPLPGEIEVLLKTMLAADPDLRPHSMTEVADALGKITEEQIKEAKERPLEQASASASAIRKLRSRQIVLACLVAVLLVVAGWSWFQLGLKTKEGADVLENFANQSAPSVAFVLVEYWLEDEKERIYYNRSEGTAFLVDSDGYLLTNRHVACPWLEDTGLFMYISQYSQNNRPLKFGYRSFLWFDGQKAFNRSAGLMDSTEIEDSYFINSAFRTNAPPRLTIAGVARPPIQLRHLVASPLRDDFAVLKIEKVPQGLKPLPLEMNLNAQGISKLSRVVTLGFPLGSRTQEDSVNVSVAKGHVRRSFKDLIQIDAAFYGGNSGGPMIDMRGKVIGIGSGVAMDRAPGLVPISTPLWNMAMVLPITKAVDFLQDIKSGQVKWNGVLDLSIEEKLKNITQTARQGRWAEAMALVDEELKKSFDPQLVSAAGMMHFCARDYDGAAYRFGQASSMNAEDHIPRLMIYLIDWIKGSQAEEKHRKALLALDWRSPSEFLGYLTRILDGQIEKSKALKAWESESEKSWLHYIVGLILAKENDLASAEEILKNAVLSAEPEGWEYYLARAKLEEIQKKRLASFPEEVKWTQYQKRLDAFDQVIEKEQGEKKDRNAKMVEFQSQIEEHTISPKAKLEALEKLFEMMPQNGDILVALSFYSAIEESWEKALEYTRSFLSKEGRESASRLSLSLLEAGLLHKLGHQDDARTTLQAFSRRTRDSLYRSISDTLMGKRTQESLNKEVGESPENLITGHTALGFWAEGSGQNDQAIEHYKKALESFFDTWIEFDFARERIKRLRQPSK